MPKLDIDTVKSRFTKLFAGFTSGQKAVLALAFLAVVLGGYVFTKWSSTTPMVPLFSNLASADASAVTEELTGQGVSYELADGGSTVMVPRTDVYQLRLDLSAAGLPSEGNAGYSLLDEQGITTSDFRQRVDYQRALEGELANTIGAIDGVGQATVHLVIPEDDLFSADESKPTASVLIRERPGASIDSGQVRAVVHLVSSSVEGLLPEDVAVADAEGNVLNAPGEEGMDNGDLRSEQTLGFEHSLSTNIETLLAPLVGNGKAVVRVNATLDFDRRSTTTESFDEEGAPVVNETTTNETFTGEGVPAEGGVMGPDGLPLVTDGGSDYQKEAAERTFAVGKVTETVQSAPGSVQRLSVAVLVDGAAGNVNANAVQDLVTAAAGLDPARGDTVVVEQAAFDTSAEDAAAEAAKAADAAQSKNQLMGILQTAGSVLLVLVVLFLAYRSAKRSTISRVPLPVAIGPVGAGNDVIELSAAEAIAPPAPAALGASGTVNASSQLGELIARQPDDVAQMLRGWLADRRS